MDWLTLPLASALFMASADAALKAFFSRGTWAELALARLLYSVPAVALFLFLVDLSGTTSRFWMILGLALPLEVTALILYNQAIFSSPLSLTLPFLAFSPVLLVLTGWLILGERVSPLGGLGILLVGSGAYVLNLDKIKDGGLWAPIRAIRREPGSWRMLTAATIFAATAALGKAAILIAGPVTFVAVYYPLIQLTFLPILIVWGRPKLGSVLARPWAGTLVGVLTAAMILTHAYGMLQSQAAYVVAVKRSHLLFGALYGLLLFKEGLAGQRLIGAALALAGVIVLGFAG